MVKRFAKKKYVRRAKKAVYRKKYRKSNKKYARKMARSFDPFPLFLHTRLRYVDRKSVTGAAGYWTSEWRANSMYDIDYNAVGHQPMGFDQLAALYHRYRVYGLAYDFTIINEGTEPIQLTMYCDNTTGVTIDPNDAAEKKNARTVYVGGSGGKQISRLKGYLNIKKMLGYKSNTDDDLSALVSTNPAQVLFLNMAAYTADGSASTMNATIITRFRFYAKFYDVVQITGS